MEAPGIEAEHETSPHVVSTPQILGDSTLAPTTPADDGQRFDPDAALWAAIEAATAARDGVRAAALMAELQRRPAPVLTLATTRGRR